MKPKDLDKLYYRDAGCPRCGGNFNLWVQPLVCLEEPDHKFTLVELRDWADFIHGLVSECHYFGWQIQGLGDSIPPFDVQLVAQARMDYLAGKRTPADISRCAGDFLLAYVKKRHRDYGDLSRVEKALSKALEKVLRKAKPQPRKWIVRQHMKTPKDFTDTDKVKILFEALDRAAGVPIPKLQEDPEPWRPMKWIELLDKPDSPEYSMRVQLLTRDLYDRKVPQNES